MSNYRILLIDDSAIIRKFSKKLLEPIGAEVFVAGDGEQGLKIIKEERIDLILTDIEMPKMNGLEFCQIIKNNTETRGIPIIVVSSLNTEEDIERSFKAGANEYISKNELQDRLLPCVKKVLSKNSLQKDKVIAIVEDSTTIRNTVVDGLAKAGFQVITAKNGKEGFDLVTTTLPDLVLSDINMPEMNGFELCKALNKNPETTNIPFIVMSTQTESASMKRILEYGAAAYIVKPFNIDELIILVEKIFSDHFLLLLKEKERLDTERRLILASIGSLINALEARDAYTRGHSDAVCNIVTKMVELSGASQNEIEEVNIGSRLHDIGKIGIRDIVLLKPGKLTDSEFRQIKKHPTIGSNILSTIPSFSEIIPIVLHHHERFDGKGYPDGLKGENIPLWARITAVADTYHALTSNRPYRNGMPKEKALQIITDVKETQLCPDCVELFMKWVNQ